MHMSVSSYHGKSPGFAPAEVRMHSPMHVQM